MSTLAGFDAIANQNVITGLTSVPNQLVMDGSRLFAGNPSLPCGAATTTYGSGHHHHHHHFDAALFSEAFQYAAAAAAATTAASHAPFHPFAAPPPIYSPSPSGNNNNNNNNNSNLRSIHDMTISSQTDEDCSFNDDEDSSILSNLPNSCHDFELKELHIRLERNHSSPLVGGHSSPALSSRLSSNCPSTEPPTDPAEPEDLEVQFINECFEEQQRQSQMYQSGDLKSLFYHGSSELDSSKVTYRSVTDKSMHSSLERPERLPYAKKLSSLEKLVNTQYDCRPLTPASFLNFSENFEPLIDQKPEALIISQTREEQKTSPCRRRVSEPLTQKPILFWTSSLRADSSYLGSGDMFGPVKTNTSFIDSRAIAATDYVITSDSSRCEDETEALAKGVIESLFSGSALTPLTPDSEQKVHSDPVLKPQQSRAVRRLFMDNTSDCGTPDNLIKFERDSDATSEPAVLLDSVEPSCLSVSPPIAGGPQVASGGDASRNDRPVVVDDEVGDSWEDLDDTKLEEQMNALKLEAALRRPMNYSSAPVTTQSSWEPHLLPHVLEAYDVPEYVLAEDVANALATTDFGSAVVKWLERKIVFVVFESERQAREALVFHKHQWLRLRPLSKSPVRVQVKALEIQAQLRPTRSRPKTNVGIARRMVESTLGMRSSVSMEQRKMENKQIADAKAAKKNYVRWDD